MKTPEKEILDKLWANLAPTVEAFCHAFVVTPGAKRHGKLTAREVARDCIIEAIEKIYRDGVALGYDIAHHVLGEGE